MVRERHAKERFHEPLFEHKGYDDWELPAHQAQLGYGDSKALKGNAVANPDAKSTGSGIMSPVQSRGYSLYGTG